MFNSFVLILQVANFRPFVEFECTAFVQHHVICAAGANNMHQFILMCFWKGQKLIDIQGQELADVLIKRTRISWWNVPDCVWMFHAVICLWSWSPVSPSYDLVTSAILVTGSEHKMIMGSKNYVLAYICLKVQMKHSLKQNQFILTKWLIVHWS